MCPDFLEVLSQSYSFQMLLRFFSLSGSGRPTCFRLDEVVSKIILSSCCIYLFQTCILLELTGRIVILKKCIFLIEKCQIKLIGPSRLQTYLSVGLIDIQSGK